MRLIAVRRVRGVGNGRDKKIELVHITAYFTTNEVEKDEVYSVRNFHALLTEDEKASAINRTPLSPFHAGFTFHFVTFAMSSLPHKHSRHFLPLCVVIFAFSSQSKSESYCNNGSNETASEKNVQQNCIAIEMSNKVW